MSDTANDMWDICHTLSFLCSRTSIRKIFKLYIPFHIPSPISSQIVEFLTDANINLSPICMRQNMHRNVYIGVDTGLFVADILVSHQIFG